MLPCFVFNLSVIVHSIVLVKQWPTLSCTPTPKTGGGGSPWGYPPRFLV